MFERWKRSGIPDEGRVLDAIVLDELDALGLPHVVHVVDHYLDVPLVFGPFRDPSEAAAFADRYRADLNYDGCDLPPVTVITPLRPVNDEPLARDTRGRS